MFSALGRFVELASVLALGCSDVRLFIFVVPLVAIFSDASVAQ